jgi:ferritin-like metal-binding protein YciE
MSLDSMRDLLVGELKDLYSGEIQLVRLLPLMVRGAGHPPLRRALTQHLNQTEQRLARMQDVFDHLGASPRGTHCQGMEGLLEEARSVLTGKGIQRVVDAALVSVMRRIIHYELVVYCSAADHAARLDFDGAADLLQQSLAEEEHADALFFEIATREINARAMLSMVETAS